MIRISTTPGVDTAQQSNLRAALSAQYIHSIVARNPDQESLYQSSLAMGNNLESKKRKRDEPQTAHAPRSNTVYYDARPVSAWISQQYESVWDFTWAALETAMHSSLQRIIDQLPWRDVPRMRELAQRMFARAKTRFLVGESDPLLRGDFDELLPDFSLIVGSDRVQELTDVVKMFCGTWTFNKLAAYEVIYHAVKLNASSHPLVSTVFNAVFVTVSHDTLLCESDI